MAGGQCLGGMADGPCGEQFKAAFSCFVFSEAEPKGMDCVDRFKNMQDCFREHPDVYGEGPFPLPPSFSLTADELMMRWGRDRRGRGGSEGRGEGVKHVG